MGAPFTKRPSQRQRCRKQQHFFRSPYHISPPRPHPTTWTGGAQLYCHVGTDRSSHTIYGHDEASVIFRGKLGEATLDHALRTRLTTNSKQSNFQLFFAFCFFCQKVGSGGTTRSRIPKVVRAERGRRGYITRHKSARRLRNAYVAVHRRPGQARVATKWTYAEGGFWLP